MAQVTGDPSTDIFTIEFNNDWVSNNFEINGRFTFYAFLAYNYNVLTKRDSEAIALRQPTNVSIVPIAGRNLKFSVALSFADATIVVSIV